MNQDVNKIIDVISNEWASQLLQANKKIGILSEQNERLQKEIERLKRDLENKTEDNKEEK